MIRCCNLMFLVILRMLMKMVAAWAAINNEWGLYLSVKISRKWCINISMTTFNNANYSFLVFPVEVVWRQCSGGWTLHFLGENEAGSRCHWRVFWVWWWSCTIPPSVLKLMIRMACWLPWGTNCLGNIFGVWWWVTKNITTAKMPRKNRRCHWKRNAKPNVRKQIWKTAAQWSNAPLLLFLRSQYKASL